MTIFKDNKQKLKTLGASFPFIEQRKDGLALKYDAIKIVHAEGEVTMTYMQGDIPIYAYTFEAPANYEVTFNDMEGSVKVKFSQP